MTEWVLAAIPVVMGWMADLLVLEGVVFCGATACWAVDQLVRNGGER